MDMTISKRGITLGRTSQIICHAHVLFMCILYSNFHVDDLKTVVEELDRKRQRKDDLSPNVRVFIGSRVVFYVHCICRLFYNSISFVVPLR